MKLFHLGSIALLISYLLLIVFSNRGLFFSTFDAVYWQDKYEHSQWKLPLSVRTLGDDGLYLYEGYRLMHGGDPTLLNAEVPPLGKYLIGITNALFGNPYWFGFIVNLGILTCVFLLTKRLTASTMFSSLAILLLATDPLFTNQYALTMLDSLQALFLLIYCLLIIKSTDQKKGILLWPTLAGLSLGFFSETKFPLLVPIPLLLGIWQLWRHTKSITSIVMLGVGLITGYLLPYIQYFLHGHSFLEWLKVQKWIVSFYLSSKIIPTYGSVLTNLTVGYYQNIFSRIWLISPHWSPVWPVLLITLLTGLFRARKNTPTLFITLLTLGIIGFYTIIPFWTRYIVLILPFLYLLFIFAIQAIKPKIGIFISMVFVTANVLWSLPTFFPTPDGMFSLFTYSWKNNFFADMYEDITPESKANWSRIAFREFGLNTVYDGEIEKVEIHYDAPTISRFATTASVPIRVTYVTRHLGPFDVETTIPLKKVNNRWTVVWDWSLYLPDLSESTHLKTTVIEGKRGEIIMSDKGKLANDFQSFLISVTPKDIDPVNESTLLLLFEELFDRKVLSVYFHQRIYGNTLSIRPIPIGVLPRVLVPEEVKQLTGYSGVTLTPHIGRRILYSDFIKVGNVGNAHVFECCSWLYTTGLYDGTEGLEKDKNILLKGENGGTLILKDEKDATLHTFIQKTKKDGGNVQL
ncbi:MAG: NTF2-like N-terminal transpeptidase domain-containing protein [Patescibacteria group bacterium]